MPKYRIWSVIDLEEIIPLEDIRQSARVVFP